MEVGEGAYTVTQGKNKFQAKRKGKGKIPPRKKLKNNLSVFFVKRKDT